MLTRVTGWGAHVYVITKDKIIKRLLKGMDYSRLCSLFTFYRDGDANAEFAINRKTRLVGIRIKGYRGRRGNLSVCICMHLKSRRAPQSS
jgi:hypothetical protein